MSETFSPLEMFYRWERETPDLIFLRQSLGNGEWQEYSWRQVGDLVRRIAQFLKDQNYPAGSRIALWSSNSVDWILVDFAIMLSGHITVPLYPGQDCKSANFVLEQTQAPLIFIGPCGQEHQIERALTDDIKMVAIRGCGVPCDFQLTDIVAQTAPYSESPVPDHDSLFTIVYSSGTSGKPKGVMHTHGTPGRMTPVTATLFDMKPFSAESTHERTRLISYLPLAHIAERALIELPGLYSNACISISAGPDHFLPEIQSVQPTFFFAVPRIWVKLKLAIEAMMPESHDDNLDTATRQKIRQTLGLDKAAYVMTGSAPTPVDVHRWFLRQGILLREGYGLTETLASGAYWLRDDHPQPGSIGTAHMGAEAKLAENGEILLRTKGMMKGYYLLPEHTAKVLQDGWLHTGDLARLDELGNIWITGRLGDVFKTSKGKFIQPKSIEHHFNEVEELEQVIILGHGMSQPILIANISPHGKTLGKAELEARLKDALERINSSLAAHERVKQILITELEWTADNGLLTPTLKLKRSAAAEHYADLIKTADTSAQIVWLHDE